LKNAERSDQVVNTDQDQTFDKLKNRKKPPS